MTRKSDHAADHAAPANRGAAGNPGAARDCGMRPDDHVVTDLDLIVQLYPMLDDRSTSAFGVAANPNHRMWSARSNHFGWAAYLGNADPQVAVPARNEDLSGLPPAWIGVGSHDLFHDEDLAYAERLKDAGVPAEVEVVPGAFHGFDLVVPKARVSRRFFASQCDVLRSALQTVG